MPAALNRTRALTRATALDLLLRPGLALATLAVGTLLLLLPHLTLAEFDPRGALSVELALSTMATYVALVLGLAGIGAMSREGEFAPGPEIRATPLRLGEYAAARWLGLGLGGGALTLGLSLFYFIGYELLAEVAATPGLVSLGGVVAGGLLAAGTMAALGLLLGATLPAPLAVVLLIGYLAVSRVALPEAAAGGGLAGALGALLPDPARLDLARDTLFGPRLPGRAVAAAAVAAVCQGIGLCALAAVALRRREER